jgi:rpsU-divergently transcribed protein
MQKTIKTLGNIETDHPYYEKLSPFFDALLLEMPFCKHLNDAVDNVLKNNIISNDEYIIMFSKGVPDIIACLVDYLNMQTIDYCNDNADIKGVKAILKTLIMFQIRLKPNMPDNFKKVFNTTLFKTIPISNITYFYALIDTLWHCAGDTATDYNYYSKRFLLGNIYLETILYACSDTSENYADTENYLIRSFDKIKLIEELKAKLPNVTKFQKNIASFLGKLRYQ